MDQRRKVLSTKGIRERAAEGRRHWTASERLQRTGLPPDLPSRLRDYLTDWPQLNWPIMPPFELNETRDATVPLPEDRGIYVASGNRPQLVFRLPHCDRTWVK